ncbi:MAG: glycosyltransferase [Solirubrobacteraceae bacterium]
MSVFEQDHAVRGEGTPHRVIGHGSNSGPDQGSPAALHVAMLDVDLADGLQAIPDVDDSGAIWTSALVLVRVFTEPIGVVELAIPAGGVGADDLARAIGMELEMQVRERIVASGLAWGGSVPIAGLCPAQAPPFLASRERILGQAPSLTVAICTRNRPQELSRALASVARQEYPSLHVVVVDNDPLDERARAVAAEYEPRLDLTYVVEPRRGVSWARNRAIEVSDSEILAWIDDDGEPWDRWWAAEMVRAFVEHPEAGAASGMILPTEIETPAQRWFEQYGGHSKGRGFTPDVFSAAGGRAQSPLYPLPPFGAGGNMAFRAEALELIGGFDCALGPGTPTLAGEDTAVLSTLLYKGGTVVWQPTAMIRHQHRRDLVELSEMLHGYGRGLGAFYASMVLRHPKSVPQLARLAPRALVDFISPRGPRLGGLAADFPRELLKVHRAGLLQGPAMYVRARFGARRLSRQARTSS